MAKPKLLPQFLWMDRNADPNGVTKVLMKQVKRLPGKDISLGQQNARSVCLQAQLNSHFLCPLSFRVYCNQRNFKPAQGSEIELFYFACLMDEKKRCNIRSFLNTSTLFPIDGLFLLHFSTSSFSYVFYCFMAPPLAPSKDVAGWQRLSIGTHG